jgi:hypothetical protein
VTIANNGKILVGVVRAKGYIIRKAKISITSNDTMETPETPVNVEIVADLVWVNRSNDNWIHSNDNFYGMTSQSKSLTAKKCLME